MKITEVIKERRKRYFNDWIKISNELKKNDRQSLINLIKKHKVNEHCRYVFVQMGLLEKRGSGTISYWYVLKNAQKESHFNEIYDNFLKRQIGVIYVFNSDNEIIYQSENKAELTRKYKIGRKMLLTYAINGKSYQNNYFSYDEDFKIAKNSFVIKMPLKLKKKLAKAKLEKNKQIKTDNHVGSYNENQVLLEVARLSVIENNKLEKEGKRKVVRLDKSLTIKERLNALKGKRTDSFL